MAPTLGTGPVYFLAEAPGRDEDENSGRPLTGESGKLLRECIPDGEAKYCSFDNVVNCRPPNNRTPVWNEVECCRPRRIKWIEEAKPKLIVGMGAVPLRAILNSSDIAGMRGRLFAVKIGQHECWFMPTYHPSFILRVAFDRRKPLNSMFGHCFRMDIKRAFDLVDKLVPPKIDTEADVRAGIQCFDGHGKFKELMELLDQTQKAPLKCTDIETKGLRPFAAGAAIMTAAFSFGSTNFAFAVDHPKSGWSKDQREKILAKVEIILKDDTVKIAHNVPFELEWFADLYGPEVVNHDVWECTMLQAHVLDERKGARRDDDTGASRYQSLDFLVGQHFGTRFKSMFKLNKKDMSQSDLLETLTYNGVDTKQTLRLYKRQKRLINEAGLTQVYEEAAPRQATVALMQVLGVEIDQNAVKKAQKRLAKTICEIEGDIARLKVVKSFKEDKGAFNPASGNDVLSIFRDYLKRSEVVVKSDTGEQDRYSADKNILDKIDHPLADLIIRHRNQSKLKSTYVDGLELGVGKIVYPDNKLHTLFNTTLTETGRLSSSEPNLQNYPKRSDSWIRGLIVPPKNHVLVAIDYGQLEACTGAMCSKDKYLVKALWEDYDIHEEWAKRTAHACPELIGGKGFLTDKAVMKKFRSLIKNKLTFPAFFGATSESVRSYLHNATGYDVDQVIIDDLMDQFWDCFEGVLSWQKKTMSRYYNIGHVETLSGRRHHYPLSRNQAINMPIQGSAAELVCDAMVRLSKHAVRTGHWHLHPVLNVHDDLTFFIPDDNSILEDSLRIIMKQMLTFSFPWVNVPLSIEVSIGENWANVEPIGKFWSHKEFGYPK